jgi:hypothetical protein
MAALQKVYEQWTACFPTRAEVFALQAVPLSEYKAAQHGAVTMFSAGLAQGAQPRALLEAYLSQLSSSP